RIAREIPRPRIAGSTNMRLISAISGSLGENGRQAPQPTAWLFIQATTKPAPGPLISLKAADFISGYKLPNSVQRCPVNRWTSGAELIARLTRQGEEGAGIFILCNS